MEAGRVVSFSGDLTSIQAKKIEVQNEKVQVANTSSPAQTDTVSSQTTTTNDVQEVAEADFSPAAFQIAENPMGPIGPIDKTQHIPQVQKLTNRNGIPNSMSERAELVLKKMPKYLKGASKEQIAKLLSPGAIKAIATVGSAYGLAHAAGLPLLADGVALGAAAVGSYAIGTDVLKAANDFVEASYIMYEADTDEKLEAAAKQYADSLAVLGIDTMLVYTGAKAGELAKSAKAFASPVLSQIKSGASILKTKLSSLMPVAPVGWLSKIPGASLVLRGRSNTQSPLSSTSPVLNETAGSKRNWNQALMGELVPNATYNLRGYNFNTDATGRVSSAGGNLRLRTGDRHTNAQRNTGHSGEQGDQGGHIIATQFNGPGEAINLFPQNGNFNMGAYKSLEMALARQLREGHAVNFQAELKYTGANHRPHAIDVTYRIDNQAPITRRFLNRHGGQ